MSHEKKVLQATSIVRIISVCKEAGVREFALGDLRISFYGGEGFSGDIEPAIKRNVITDSIIGDNIEREAVELEVAMSREDQLDHMKIEDPLSWEQQFTRGELLNAENHD